MNAEETKSKGKNILLLLLIAIAGAYFAISGLVAAQTFLAPITVASLLAMMFLPLVHKMEKAGLARGWSSFISVLIALGFFAGLFFLVSFQVKQIADDWPKIEKQLKPRIEQVQQWLSEKTGVTPDKQDELVKKSISGSEKDSGNSSSAGSETTRQTTRPDQQKAKETSSSSNSLLKSIGSMVIGLFSFIGVALLTAVYVFFMLLYRAKIKKSILAFFPVEKKEEAHGVVKDSVALSQNYLFGRFLLIMILAILYSIGLAISGIKHAILISIIAATLSLLPYIGNVIGVFLALAMAGFSGGDLTAFIGVIVTFSIAQFVESYILEPYVVGHKVDLNPLITILVVVLGGAVWGIIGMIIFIPIFGIIKIVCDHIPSLKPVGYLLGEEDISSGGGESRLEQWAKKIKNMFSGKS